jgi:hypothetical protein
VNDLIRGVRIRALNSMVFMPALLGQKSNMPWKEYGISGWALRRIWTIQRNQRNRSSTRKSGVPHIHGRRRMDQYGLGGGSVLCVSCPTSVQLSTVLDQES